MYSLGIFQMKLERKGGIVGRVYRESCRKNDINIRNKKSWEGKKT